MDVMIVYVLRSPKCCITRIKVARTSTVVEKQNLVVLDAYDSAFLQLQSHWWDGRIHGIWIGIQVNIRGARTVQCLTKSRGSIPVGNASACF